MENAMKSRLTATMMGVVLLGCGVHLMAQGGPLIGKARVSLDTSVRTIAAGAVISIPLRVDVGEITVTPAAGTTTNRAALGGYQIEVRFDNSLLSLEGVAGGSAAGFTNVPAFTDVARSNAAGRVMIAAAQSTSIEGGVLHVATLRFKAKRGGLATITAAPASLASAFMNGAGPVSIVGEGSSVAMTIEAGIRLRPDERQ